MDKNKTNVMRILEKQKIPYQAFFYQSDGAIDGVSVAHKLGLDPNHVYKTLVLQGNDHNYYVAVIPVAEELDLKKVAKAFKVKKIELIPVAEINRITGYIRGGCSPIGMKKDYPLFINDTALDLSEIIVSGGKIGVQVRLPVKSIQEFRRAGFADLIKESTN